MTKEKLVYQVVGNEAEEQVVFHYIYVDEEEVKRLIRDITDKYGYKVMWPVYNEPRMKDDKIKIARSISDSSELRKSNSKIEEEISRRNDIPENKKAEAIKAAVEKNTNDTIKAAFQAYEQGEVAAHEGEQEERIFKAICVDENDTYDGLNDVITKGGLIVEYKKQNSVVMDLTHTSTEVDKYHLESVQMVDVSYKMLSFPHLAQALVTLLKDHSNIASLDAAINTELASNDIEGEEFIPRILNAVYLRECCWGPMESFESYIKGSLKTIDPSIDTNLERKKISSDSVLLSGIYKSRDKRKKK